MYFSLSFNQKFWAVAVMITIKSTKEQEQRKPLRMCQDPDEKPKFSKTGVFLVLRLENSIIHKLIPRNLLWTIKTGDMQSSLWWFYISLYIYFVKYSIGLFTNSDALAFLPPLHWPNLVIAILLRKKENHLDCLAEGNGTKKSRHTKRTNTYLCYSCL